MKRISLIVVMLMIAASTIAQSNSYLALKEKFKDQPDVHSFSLSGWVGRLVLNLAGEYEFKDAIKDLRHMRLMTIPRTEFDKQQVTVKGFKKVLRQDSFEELAFVRDDGEEITIYLHEGNNHKNHYFVLVEEEQEVIAIELKGYLDPKLLNPKTTTLAINK